MLKYFKRQKSRRGTSQCGGGGGSVEENDDDSTLIVGNTNNNNNNNSSTDISSYAKRHSLRSSSSFCDDFLQDEVDSVAAGAECGGGGDGVGSLSLCGASIGTGVGTTTCDEDIFKYHSRLCMTLPSIVSEPNCLSFFVQYLETKNALSLIKFYLDTENFRTAAVAQLEREQTASQLEKNNSQQKNHKDEAQLLPILEQNKQPTSVTEQNEHEDEVGEDDDNEEEEADEQNNSVPELKSLYDLSMRKPLTDDEKSQIYAETNKQITKHSISNHSDTNGKMKASSELSLSSLNSTTVETEEELEPECSRVAGMSAASIKDAIAVYQKYLIANAQQFVSLPVSILSQISLLLCKRDDGDAAMQSDAAFAAISPNCFNEAQLYVLKLLERDYLNEFLQSTFYCKYCIELIERGSPSYEERLTIYDILYSEVTLFFFMEFLEQHGERDCLDFWTTAINYRKSYATDEATSTKEESEAQSDAMIIYEKFFSLQSDCRLWLSDKLRCRVEERICAAGHVAYCFDLALQITAKYLEKKYFESFLKSQLFENYLNELKTKLYEEVYADELPQEQGNTATDASASRCGAAAGGNQPKLSSKRTTNKSAARHRKTLSDCTNENTRDLFKHVSAQNTLLAMDTTHLKHLHSAGTNLNIDSRHLTNPNLLWKRSNSAEGGGLKFGRVNSLGRYERDFDAVDAVGAHSSSGKHSWSLSFGGNKIKNAMRKLVNLPEDKVQEEIAWQVAEMIVKDVTSITLSNGNLNSASTEELKQ